MLITLSNKELTTAVTQYLGDEYQVTNIKFVISRSGGTSTKAEVSATREEPSNPPWDQAINEAEIIEVPDEKSSLFKRGHNE